MKVRNVITLLLFVIVLSMAAYFLVPSYIRDRKARTDLEDIRESLRQQEEEFRILKQELEDLRTDYRAIERVAREKFGLCREGEEIYHFEQPVSIPADTPPPAKQKREE